MADQPRTTLDEVRAHRVHILDAAARYGISNIRVFGSVARGTDNPMSDIDLLVDFDAAAQGLGPLAAFRADVTDILGRPVDVATPELLRDDIRDQTLRDAVPL